MRPEGRRSAYVLDLAHHALSRKGSSLLNDLTLQGESELRSRLNDLYCKFDDQL